MSLLEGQSLDFRVNVCELVESLVCKFISEILEDLVCWKGGEYIMSFLTGQNLAFCLAVYGLVESLVC